MTIRCFCPRCWHMRRSECENDNCKCCSNTSKEYQVHKVEPN